MDYPTIYYVSPVSVIYAMRRLLRGISFTSVAKHTQYLSQYVTDIYFAQPNWTHTLSPYSCQTIHLNSFLYYLKSKE